MNGVVILPSFPKTIPEPTPEPKPEPTPEPEFVLPEYVIIDNVRYKVSVTNSPTLHLQEVDST